MPGMLLGLLELMEAAWEAVTQLVFPSIDQSREVEVPSKIFDLIETRFDIRF